MNHRKRIGTILLCAAFVLVLFVSSAYLVHEAGHHCSDKDCQVCRTIAMTTELLRAFGILLLIMPALFAPAVRLHSWQCQSGTVIPASGTLVSWKIRLND